MFRRSLLLALIGIAACRGNEDPTDPVSLLQAVQVALSISAVRLGQSASAKAIGITQFGDSVEVGTATWTSSATSVATISQSGAITPVGEGQTAITAVADGQTGRATLTVTGRPVASVTLAGASHIKVGDSYAYTVVQKLADGTVVERPVAFKAATPGTATVTDSGMVTPLKKGTIAVIATIDSLHWTFNLISYDWTPRVTPDFVSASLDADSMVSNPSGVAAYPRLTITCGKSGSLAGVFSVAVDLPNIVTGNGAVLYTIGSGMPVASTWLESPLRNALTYLPANTSAQKSFAAQLSRASSFSVLFSTSPSGTGLAVFRLTGMTAAIAPVLAACPGGSLNAAPRPF